MRAASFATLIFFVYCGIAGAVDNSISNLNTACFRCLCRIHGCDRGRGCQNGFCGPFYIPREYWGDAGQPTLTEDDEPGTQEAYENCTKDYNCSVETIRNYLIKYARDCNGDGVTDCFDFMMINYNGGPNCSPPLTRDFDGSNLVRKFRQCRL